MVTTSRASFARRSGFLRPGTRLGAAADPPGAVSAHPVAPPTCSGRKPSAAHSALYAGAGFARLAATARARSSVFFSGPVLQPTSSVSASSSCRGLSRKAGVLASSPCFGFFSGAPAAPAEAQAQAKCAKKNTARPSPSPSSSRLSSSRAFCWKAQVGRVVLLQRAGLARHRSTLEAPSLHGLSDFLPRRVGLAVCGERPGPASSSLRHTLVSSWFCPARWYSPRPGCQARVRRGRERRWRVVDHHSGFRLAWLRRAGAEARALFAAQAAGHQRNAQPSSLAQTSGSVVRALPRSSRQRRLLFPTWFANQFVYQPLRPASSPFPDATLKSKRPLFAGLSRDRLHGGRRLGAA